MSKGKNHKLIWVLVVIAGVVLFGGLGFILGSGVLPVRVMEDGHWKTLSSEIVTMNECMECHESENYHTCETCHDDHGAIELSGVPFFAMIELTGDFPIPGFVTVHEILPYHEQPHTSIQLADFLVNQGVEDFERVVLISNDGGFVTIEKEALNQNALLLPYSDGIRFASEDLHVSTWLKGLQRIIVVGNEKPLLIDGVPTSIGRLFLGPTRTVTVESANVMLQSENDGQIRKATTAAQLAGIPIEQVINNQNFTQLNVLDQNGEVHQLTPADAEGAILATINGRLSLVLPERGRPQWIQGIRAIESIE